MNYIINLIKNSIGIVFDIIFFVLSVCVIPFGFVLFAIFTIPKILFTAGYRFRFFICFAFVCLAVMGEVYFAGNFNDFGRLVNYCIYYLSSIGVINAIILFTAMFFGAALLSYIFTGITKVVFKIDEFVRLLFFYPLSVCVERFRSICRRFDMITFGTPIKKEKFEVKEFRKKYDLPL